MANLYGVASPLPLPVYGTSIGSVDVACPAGSETNVIAIATNVPISQGIYYPAVSGTLFVTLGATPPTAMTYNARIGAGADFSGNQVNANYLIASATLQIPFMFFGTAALLSYPTGALTFNISLNPTAQAVTCRFIGSFAFAWWQRAPDQ